MTIQVYNLGRDIRDADLRRLFSPYGIVNSAEVMRDKLNGRSKGNGIVSMPVDKDAQRAIESLDQTLMDGKKISVSELRQTSGW